ncbi:MAG: hypothetical protein ABSB32_22210 [Thermodesulfobacteriota bacterium]
MERNFEIVNWGRFFALYENGKLLCLTVYEKLAAAIERRLEELKAELEEAQKGQPQSQDEKEAKHVE